VRDYEREGIVLQGIQVPPDLLAPTLPGVGRAHTERMAAVERMASFGALISDTSEGRVLGRSRPVPWYRMSERDVRKMQRAVALLSRIFFAAGAREVYPGVRQRPVLRSAEEADALERLPLRAADFELMAFHPMGTARMGSDPARSAVDPGGRLRGAPAVRVADASLFPSSSRLNPQLTIMALATRVARSLVEEAPRPAPRA
jgi:choline dehydrogenase-like flavoprotein